MDKAKLRDAVKMFEELVQKHRKANRLMAQLVIHPEATDEQILAVCHERRRSAISIRETGEKLRAALCSTPGINYSRGGEHLSDYVARLMRENL